MADKKIKICVLKTDGTNCDRETAFAFNTVTGDSKSAEIVHISSLAEGYDHVKEKKICLDDYHILAIPGGFSGGDYIAAGRIFAEEIRHSLGDALQTFIAARKPIIGICNGFQVLVKYGLLPGLDGSKEQTTTLTYNDNGRFNDWWVQLMQPPNSRCTWTKGIKSISLPVAHGEGKFVAPPQVIERLHREGLVSFQYAGADGNQTMGFPANPNGSIDGIAGICDPTGLIFGLMPHPERYNNPDNHHLAPLKRILARSYVNRSDTGVAERVQRAGELPREGPGLQIFRNGVDYVVKNLLG